MNCFYSLVIIIVRTMEYLYRQHFGMKCLKTFFQHLPQICLMLSLKESRVSGLSLVDVAKCSSEVIIFMYVWF